MGLLNFTLADLTYFVTGTPPATKTKAQPGYVSQVPAFDMAAFRQQTDQLIAMELANPKPQRWENASTELAPLQMEETIIATEFDGFSQWDEQIVNEWQALVGSDGKPEYRPRQTINRSSRREGTDRKVTVTRHGR